jgi:signal transduction histidine kinase
LCELYINNPKKGAFVQPMLKLVESQVERGAKLALNVHKLSLIDNNEIILEKIDVIYILQKVIAYLKKSFSDKNLSIQCDFISEEIYIQGNELIEDVFENIFNNSIKYNENSTIEIIVKITKKQKQGNNFIKIEISDNGVGIVDNRKKILFQRGYKKDEYIHGMGLGLSLVKKIVDHFNGEIWIEDRKKGDYTKGTKLILLIPEGG